MLTNVPFVLHRCYEHMKLKHKKRIKHFSNLIGRNGSPDVGHQ